LAVDALVESQGAPFGLARLADPLASSVLRSSVPPDPLDGYRAWIVPHTHWDREWYLPFEQFRIRLVRTLEEIADVMDADERITHFTLDGQTILLEDCAELRPDLIDRLRRLANQGRLSIGPGYVLPDEFLPGPESLVRNLLHGQKVARRFGFEPMTLGYAPDPFGHPAQLPQILQGFGLNDFLFWRGLGDAADSVGALFWWVAPDGTRVLAHQLLGSYGNANQLGTWVEEGVQIEGPFERTWAAAHRPERFMTRHAGALGRSRTKDLLLCNGSDHERIQPDIADMVEAMADAHPGLKVAISGYAEYVSSSRVDLPSDLPEYTGEMVDGRVAPVLRGINSARMPLKQAYAATEDRLLAAEAAAALATLRTGARYPAPELEHAWRELLRNAPHDSVSGCSVDETHGQMAGRFEAANQIAARIKREAICALAGTQARWSYREPVADAYSVVNLLPWTRSAVVELQLPAGVFAADNCEGVLAATDGARDFVNIQRSHADPDKGFALVELPSFGATTIALASNGSGAPSTTADARVVGTRRLENGVVRVTVDDDGTLTVEDLENGASWPRAHVLEDVADRGDEYNFCPVERDTALTSAGTLIDCTIIESGPVVAELELKFQFSVPISLTDDRSRRARTRVGCDAVSRVRLVAGARRIEFRTHIENRALDHRLRVLFPSYAHSRTVQAEGAYALVERPTRPSSDGAGWLEPPSPTQHTRGLVAAGAISVAGRGLPEYEAIETEDGVELALTLVRCVGWLSREDLSTRPGGAGPSLEVPGAQCQGSHVFEYAVWVGHADATQRLREAAEWRRPVVVGEAGVDHTSLLDVGGYGFADGALKGAEDGNGVVLRVFAGPDGGCVELPADVDARSCRLDEAKVQDVDDGEPLGAQFPLPAARIASWRLRGTPSARQ
jgi:mannosylglycerate hydrolase